MIALLPMCGCPRFMLTQVFACAAEGGGLGCREPDCLTLSRPCRVAELAFASFQQSASNRDDGEECALDHPDHQQTPEQN
jgi:hypothetical protein